jgi:hypothetical protein
MTRLSERLKVLFKPLAHYGKTINIVVVLGFIMLAIAGSLALTDYAKKPQTIILKQTSSHRNSVVQPKTTTAPTPTTSTPATTPTVTPAAVPQTVSNNQHLALLCSQAQGSYDQLSTSALSQEESETSAADGDAAQINQINQTYNSEVAGEYAGYLEQVQAVPGCVADFSAPTPFSMLPTN